MSIEHPRRRERPAHSPWAVLTSNLPNLASMEGLGRPVDLWDVVDRPDEAMMPTIEVLADGDVDEPEFIPKQPQEGDSLFAN
jgi:hypothetical protein